VGVRAGGAFPELSGGGEGPVQGGGARGDVLTGARRVGHRGGLGGPAGAGRSDGGRRRPAAGGGHVGVGVVVGEDRGGRVGCGVVVAQVVGGGVAGCALTRRGGRAGVLNFAALLRHGELYRAAESAYRGWPRQEVVRARRPQPGRPPTAATRRGSAVSTDGSRFSRFAYPHVASVSRKVIGRAPRRWCTEATS